MKVDKDKFDALLKSMVKAKPEPEKDLIIKGKAKQIIPTAPVPRKSSSQR